MCTRPSKPRPRWETYGLETETSRSRPHSCLLLTTAAASNSNLHGHLQQFELFRFRCRAIFFCFVKVSTAVMKVINCCCILCATECTKCSGATYEAKPCGGISDRQCIRKHYMPIYRHAVIPNSHLRRRRRDTTVELSRVGVAGVNGVLVIAIVMKRTLLRIA